MNSDNKQSETGVGTSSNSRSLVYAVRIATIYPNCRLIQKPFKCLILLGYLERQGSSIQRCDITMPQIGEFIPINEKQIDTIMALLSRDNTFYPRSGCAT